MNHIATQPKNQRGKVLVVAHADGTVHVYADDGVDIIFRLMPAVSTPAAEILAEQWVESTLPRPYQDIYYPGNLRASGQVRTMSVHDIANVRDDLFLLRSLDEFAYRMEEVQKCTA